MPNAIPILESTAASGGYLVPDNVRETLVKNFNTETGLFQLVQAQQAVGKRDTYPIFNGRPTVGLVAEGGVKPVTGAEYGQLVIDMKKFAAIVMYTQELLEDAREDPNVLVNSELSKEFANTIEAHAIGLAAGVAITGGFNVELAATSLTTELGTGGDAFAKAVSTAMALLEAEGARPSGILAASDMRGHLRDARSTVETANPVYQGFNGPPIESLYGVNIAYTQNLDGLPAGGGKIAAIVGDFSAAKLLVRKDLTLRTSSEASIVDGASVTHNLFQENKVAALWECRFGFNALDINRNFVTITNAS